MNEFDLQTQIDWVYKHWSRLDGAIDTLRSNGLETSRVERQRDIAFETLRTLLYFMGDSDRIKLKINCHANSPHQQS